MINKSNFIQNKGHGRTTDKKIDELISLNCHTAYQKEFMVQIQTFTTSDYLFLKICFNNNNLQNQKKK